MIPGKIRSSEAISRDAVLDPIAAVLPTPTAKEARKRWAALIKQVYEADPLLCPKCGATMRIVSFIFIERHQSEVIRLRRGFGRTGRKDSAALRVVGGDSGSRAARPVQKAVVS